MSKRHAMDRRLHSYAEIHDILSAMKNLALMETMKLQRFIEQQRRVVTSIEDAAADLLHHYPELLLPATPRRNVYLLLGTERGFCGDMNDHIPAALDREWATRGPGAVVVVGSRLANKMRDDRRITANLPGATVVEEVQSALGRVAAAIREQSGPLSVTVLHHRDDRGSVNVSCFNPFRELATQKTHRHAPRLNLEPRIFLDQLVEHYLFAALHDLFYSALLVENQRRIQHTEGAVRRLEQRSAQLVLERNRLRQEEITEEIEVIMLSATSMQ